MRVELIMKRMSSKHSLMVFLVDAVIFLAKNTNISYNKPPEALLSIQILFETRLFELGFYFQMPKDFSGGSIRLHIHACFYEDFSTNLFPWCFLFAI